MLDDKDYEEFINEILNQLKNIPEKTKFAHLIDLSIEIMKINQDRFEKIWVKICILLKLAFSRNKIDKNDQLLVHIDNENLKNLIFTLNEMSIKKMKKKTFLQSFSKFCLLELCLSHLHFCSKFSQFDDCLQEGLNYLNDCSISLLEEFNNQLNSFILSNKLCQTEGNQPFQ